MASKKLIAINLILSLLFFSTFSSACGPCKPKPKPTPPASCPRDTLKLGACADILGLVNVAVGTPPYTKCCPLLGGLADLDVALCLCTAIKANVLGINLNIPVALSVLMMSLRKGSVTVCVICFNNEANLSAWVL
ncbi:hypothetical protein OIU76_027473 [Salix suchowensis]|nr:hypothetical protein OIU78_023459 [Salix suchowensis]KAJ6373145.1 hypothetical protein OIU76_027473 [Salix suchowensis]